MKHTDTELEEILNQLIASTRSPRGRFSAAASYPELEKRLKSHTRHLTLIRTFSAAAAVVLLCLSVWTAYLYMQPAAIQTISTLAETRSVRLPDGSSVTLNHYSSLARELSNSFGATIQIADTTLQNYRITARFRDGEDLATILSVLHNAGYFNYSQNNKQIIITAKPD